jgi:two-component system chemotaxis response regulator CheB
LAAGAVDVLEKPTDAEPEGAWERRFLAMAKLVARIRVITHPRGRLNGLQGRVREVMPASPAPSRKHEIVAIGASTGGPGAIVEILRGLPAAFAIPIVIVMHINEPFGAAFADWLDGQTARRVSHPKEGTPVAAAAGRVVLAPGGQHLVVRDKRLFFMSGPERHSCRPSVDVLFETVATEYGASAAACLLTGMGRDGALGLLKIRQAGGTTIAQDESTSIVYGMPREAALLGAAQQILRIGDIAPRLAALDRVNVEACA